MRQGFITENRIIPEEVLQYTPPSDPQELLRGLTLERMSAIYQALIRRQENKIDPIRSKFGRIEKEEISLSDKLLEMKEYAKASPEIQLSQADGKPAFQNTADRDLSGNSGIDENGTCSCRTGRSF